MKLIIGGSYQGKKEATGRLFGLCASDFTDGRTCAYDEIFTCRAIADFHEFIRRFMQEPEQMGALGVNAEPDAPAYSRLNRLPQELAEKNPQICIVSNEIGYGVVPVDAQERAWRELTGRICCRIAADSDTVVRVTADIPVVIKGNV